MTAAAQIDETHAIRGGSFAAAWASIEGVAERLGFFKTSVIDGAQAVAAESSAQAGAAWALSFERAYKRLYKFPRLRPDLERLFMAEAEAGGADAAARWFECFEYDFLNLGGTLLTVESNDQSVKNEARTLAARSESLLLAEAEGVRARGGSGEFAMAKALALAGQICTGVGVQVPGAGDVETEKSEAAAVIMRLSDAKWWRRQLRVLQARKLETAARELGAVCKRRGGYCSVMTLQRRFGQKRRNRELLESLEAENESGQVYSLAELSDLGVSNPVNRRNELMTRIRGFEEWAEQAGGWVPVFITQTTPSRYHSHNRSGVRNPHWDGSTPRDAQAYLSEVWARVRSAWDREKIPAFGIRVAEPHHDGCPHWHLLMWYPSHQVDKALAIYQGHALADSPPVRKEVRFKALRDELASGATGYIAKYISKNVDGLTESGDAWDANVLKTALRTEAWASTWGIRQFQQVGGASVTVWREVRRLSGAPMDSPELQAIGEAAHEGDWRGFTEAMGGAVLPRKERPLRAFMVRKQEAGEFVKNAYGEFVRKMKGLLAWEWLPVITRLHEWTVRPVKRAAVAATEAAQPPPWTCVNNCTG